MERTVTVVEVVTEKTEGLWATEGGVVTWEVFINGYPLTSGMTLEIALANVTGAYGYLFEGEAA